MMILGNSSGRSKGGSGSQLRGMEVTGRTRTGRGGGGAGKRNRSVDLLEALPYKQEVGRQAGGSANLPVLDTIVPMHLRTVSLAHLTCTVAPSFCSSGFNKVMPVMQMRCYFIFIKCHTLS